MVSKTPFTANKASFPLNPDYEDPIYEDTDAHLKLLPYADEIPDMTTDTLRIPPLPITYWRYRTCREKVAIVGLWSFVIGLFTVGRWGGYFLYGYSIGRYRLLACELVFSSLLSFQVMCTTALLDPRCSPYLSGRRRPMFPEEAMRHMMNAKTHMFESVDLIMHSRQGMTKYDFYQTTHNYAMTKKAMDTSGYKFED